MSPFDNKTVFLSVSRCQRIEDERYMVQLLISPLVMANVLCRLVEDTAWHPVTDEALANWNAPTRWLFKIFLGTPLKLWASVGHWALWHFDLSKYTPKQHPRVSILLRMHDLHCQSITLKISPRPNPASLLHLSQLCH